MKDFLPDFPMIKVLFVFGQLSEEEKEEASNDLLEDLVDEALVFCDFLLYDHVDSYAVRHDFLNS